MVNVSKRVRRARQNPRNVRFRDAVAMLHAIGFREVNARGSHHSFDNGSVTVTIVRPRGGRKFVEELLGQAVA